MMMMQQMEDLDGVGNDDDEDDCCNRWRFSQHVGPKLSAPLLSPETNDEDLLLELWNMEVTTIYRKKLMRRRMHELLFL